MLEYTRSEFIAVVSAGYGGILLQKEVLGMPEDQIIEIYSRSRRAVEDRMSAELQKKTTEELNELSKRHSLRCLILDR